MEAAKFNLRKWNSNDVDVRRELSTEEVGIAEQKILGLAWCTVNDKISVDVKSCNDYIQTLRATKRNVLKAMAKIYDPLGLLGPFTVRIKIRLQEVWRQKKEWDVIMDGETQSAFSQWQEELALLETFCVDRCLSAGSESILELHIFSDASPKAYGAVAYCRQIMPTGRILTNIVCSKNRVSPISENNKEVELTLPKLELTAALMAARLKETLVKSLCVKISAVYLWTDSSIALNWINGCGRKPKPYIKARVAEINQMSNIYDWHHCSGKLNPADLLTRDASKVESVPFDVENNDGAEYGSAEGSDAENEIVVEINAFEIDEGDNDDDEEIIDQGNMVRSEDTFQQETI
ncbi:PREDICTED: uncharacterized protein LOC108365708 [Rhagoletis zephyria]|uniref:uncharacterized protein LOC108365708 n=1 Tax=Rhagoletis zephyria TaxID=28612 RepID=UPI000811A707|nr:PREDICTED: uncharacterized protein LOC108365708 [Rhagoletis zephyria]